MSSTRIRKWLKAALQRSRMEAEMSDEMRFHIEARTEDLMKGDLSAEEASRRARMEFGSVEKYKEICREARGLRFLDALFMDLRYATRQLRKKPSVTIIAILTLASGIGANTAVFSIVDRLLLRSLPYPNGEELVMVYEIGFGNERNSVSPANWLDWQRESRSFESLAAWNTGQATLTGDGEPEQVNAQRVSAEFFPLMGVQPLLGRMFRPEDDRPGARPVVILSHRLWQRRFGGNQDVLGRTIDLNATDCEVIGVMPPGFHFVFHDTDYWAPYALDRGRAWRETAGRFISVVGRLKPSIDLTSAQAEVQALAARLEQIHPFNKDTSANVVPLREVLTGQVRNSLVALFGAVSVLLLIACLNVANLLLARTAYRRREIAVRSSLGGGRWVIARQFVMESLLLAIAGGFVGILVARWGIATLLALAPKNLLQVADVPLDMWVLAYTFGLSVLTGLLFGLVPAVAATRGSLVGHLRKGDYSSTHSAGLRQGLVIAQVAMTIVLLCGAGLLMRSFTELSGTRTGLEARGVLTLAVGLPGARYEPAQRVAFFQQAAERLKTLHGVESVGAASSPPVVGGSAGTVFQVQGEPELRLNERPMTRVRVATPGYFATLRIPLLRGREFSQEDQLPEAAPVFIINEAFANRFFPGQDPLAASISVYMQEENPSGRIIGVVGDVKEGSLRAGAEPTVFYDHI